MKKNANTRIVGQTLVLVPYKKKHVPRYHDWMKTEELQHLTGSEPLSLEEEFEMQKKWLEDNDKCTFIILDKELYETTKDEIKAMIGDANLFFNDPDDPCIAELSIMIAEPSFRQKHRGKLAVTLLLLYGIDQLKVHLYRVKIKLDNDKSIRMFEKLGFEEVSRSEVFQEVTLEKSVNDDWSRLLKSLISNVMIYEDYELNETK